MTRRVAAKPQTRRQAAILYEMKRREERERLTPVYDWYGLSCPCNLPPGECKQHPRARPNEFRELPNGGKALFGQHPPHGDWQVWMFAGGRGAGKSRTGAQFIQHAVQDLGIRHVVFVSETAADIRDVMADGPAGVCSDSVSPPWFKPVFHPSIRKVVWPNGASATCFSAERPDQLRGPQYQLAWADELGKWVNAQETWNNLEYVTRLPSEAFGDTPRFVVTTTPRPNPTYKMLINDPHTTVVRGSTLENQRHVAQSWIDRIMRKFEGTRIGRQEIHAELLEDTPGALWDNDLIDNDRRRFLPGGVVATVEGVPVPVEFVRIVVAIDPSIGSADPESGAEAGIIVGALGSDDHVYIIDDCSLKGTPYEWAEAAVAAYRRHRADRVVAEVNNGGDMVESVLRTFDSSVPYRKLWASRGKMTRAEPVASLYERHRVHHVGVYPELEGQMCGWVPGLPSPDRMDALVWVVTELAIDGGNPTEVEDDPYAGARL